MKLRFVGLGRDWAASKGGTMSLYVVDKHRAVESADRAEDAPAREVRVFYQRFSSARAPARMSYKP